MMETAPGNSTIDTVTDVFFEPLQDALALAEHTRKCPEFSDWEHLESGVGRCLERVQSGRDWIQQLWHQFSMKLGVSCFFESLGSTRRLRLVQEVDERIASRCDRDAGRDDDPFSPHPELDNFGIHAADGHYHACSAHEDVIDGKRYAVGHFFVINLRTRSMRHLDVARPKRKREHDITALKRLNPETLRMGEPKGRKVLIAYDPAVIDFMQTVEKPWIAFKVLAAGAIHPRQGFPFAFKGGADFICVGMYDFQIVEDVNICLDALAASARRQRPWRA